MFWFSKFRPPCETKVFLVIFVPGCLLSLIFAGFFFFERSKDYTNYGHEQLKLVSDQFAALYQASDAPNEIALLQRQLHAVIRNPNIISARVYNKDKNVLAGVGSKASPFPQNLLLTRYTEIFNRDEVTIAIIPLYDSLDNIDRSTNPDVWLALELNTSKIDLQKYELSGILLLLLILFNICYSLLSIYLASKFANPVKSFNNALEKASEGNYEDIKSLNVPKEYFPMLMGIITIVERLENNREDMLKSIDQATKDMRRNMDSMEEKSAQLHIANKEKTESNRLKTQFLANISHEVRTPLNAILGYTQLLQKELLDKQQRLYVNTIEQSTNNLLAIIGDILDFSKIEAGKLSLERADVNIRDLVDDIYQALCASLLTTEKTIDLVPEIDKEVPEWVLGDEIRIRQILTNLIGNAIKFTQKGFVRTKISIAKQVGDKITLQIEVIDSGIGIPDNKLPSLFKAFSQVNTSTTREFGGTGLGLVITKKLVEQMSGKISVSSEAGIGSNFRFTIQLEMSDKQTLTHENINKHVLVYEPSETYRNYLENLLTNIGATATFCSSLEHLISRLNSRDCKTETDAVLLSVGHTKEDVAQSHEVIVYTVENCNLPCIVMTQLPNKINQHVELQHLATDILLKPISHHRLYQSLQTLNQKIVPISKGDDLPIHNQLFGLNILAVDDNQINLQLVSHWLEPHGINVTLAYSGQQALELAAKEKYDLIIMDIQMPEMDGIETTIQLRSRRQTQNTPIIALTAHALKSEKKLILQSGMNDYLTKPVSEAKLISMIQTWCLGEKGEEIQTQQANKELAGIFDLEKSLEIVDQQAAIAKDMFSMLVDSLESEKQLIKHHLKEGDQEKLVQIVHRLHGASKYCGTPELTKQACFLEQHLKELGLEGVDEVVDDFIRAIDDLLDVSHLVVWPNEMVAFN